MKIDNKLEALIGVHYLSGVEPGHRDDANTLSFILDGVVYTAVEDENDGYRSAMGELFINEFGVKNTFAPQQVFCHKRDDPVRNDVLDCYDTVTGLLVLSVGTDCIDDYYPGFVAVFHPENMAINRGE